jgi:hypothetical protein
MAEETDIDGNLHMFTLDYVGMAAAAVEINPSSMLSEVRLVIKDNLPPGKIHFRFYQSHLMAPCLQALGVGHIRKRSRVISAGNVAELPRKSVQGAVFMTH